MQLFSDPAAFFAQLLYSVPAILVSLTVHEWAHAHTAWKLGDPTARTLGRLSLNPLRHLDPLGTLLLVFAGFGWAKPVPINPRYFRNPRRDDLLVSIAGVTANFIMFMAAASLLVLLVPLLGNHHFGFSLGYYMTMFDERFFVKVLVQILQRFMIINAVLMVFNLIPIPPLDGYHVLNDIVLHRSLFADPKMQYFGQIALIAGLVSGVIDKILGFFVNGLVTGVLGLFEAIWNLVAAIL